MKRIITLILILFVLGIKLNAQSFLNPSVEDWGNNTQCYVNTPPTNWIEYSNGGIGVDEANFTYCPTTIPNHAANGHVYARSYASSDTSGEGMYQNVSGFLVGTTYAITFEYAGSNLYGATDNCKWHLFINDVDVYQTPVFSSSDSIWTPGYYQFTAADTMYKIGVRAYSMVTNGSAAIDNFGIHEVVTGIENIKAENKIIVYPNPATSALTISQTVISAKAESLIITDITGREIYHQPISNTLNIIDVSYWSNGVYIYQLQGEKETVRGKFVKQ